MEHTLSLSPALGFTTQEHYEYLLLANPGEEVYKRLMAEKEIFSFCYKISVAKKTQPHITVANFLAKESMEDTLIKWTNKIISNQYGFDVMLILVAFLHRILFMQGCRIMSHSSN